MRTENLILKSKFLAVFVACVATASVIYLTPLKWINVVEPQVKDVLPALFQRELEQDPERFVFIDVRPSDVYAAEHAAGSINIPLHMLYDERHNLPKRGKQIVLICRGGRASGVGYSYLEHYGFRNLRRVHGGIEAWKEAGLPTVKASSVGEELSV